MSPEPGGIASTAYFGHEAEFYIFDEIRYNQPPNEGFYFVDSVEGQWNAGRAENPNLGYKPRFKEGYFPVSPTDTYHNLRCQMVSTMQEVGIDPEIHYHEVGSGGQAEIDIHYDTLVKMGDNSMKYKYVAKNVALRQNKTVTFMPKPIFGDLRQSDSNGDSLHRWTVGTCAFAAGFLRSHHQFLSPFSSRF